MNREPHHLTALVRLRNEPISSTCDTPPLPASPTHGRCLHRKIIEHVTCPCSEIPCTAIPHSFPPARRTRINTAQRCASRSGTRTSRDLRSAHASTMHLRCPRAISAPSSCRPMRVPPYSLYSSLRTISCKCGLSAVVARVMTLFESSSKRLQYLARLWRSRDDDVRSVTKSQAQSHIRPALIELARCCQSLRTTPGDAAARAIAQHHREYARQKVPPSIHSATQAHPSID